MSDTSLQDKLHDFGDDTRQKAEATKDKITDAARDMKDKATDNRDQDSDYDRNKQMPQP